jgi:hypothetical protein
MTTMTVWLLVMVGVVNSGQFGSVQPQLFPTAKDCEQVARNAPRTVYRTADTTVWRCIETTVLVPK